MIFKYENQDYDVIVVRKNNKNTYIRIKENKIYITTNYFITNKSIQNLLRKNYNSIAKMIIKQEKINNSKKEFKIFGTKYNIIYNESITFNITKNTIYTKNEKELDKWLNNYIKNTYQKHLDYWHKQFQENIPYPNLKIRKMKTRWGVCNTKNHNITLNYELYRYNIECLDYVIVHELSHLLEPNHKKQFWNIVEKYYPNYKIARKILRN